MLSLSLLLILAFVMRVRIRNQIHEFSGSMTAKQLLDKLGLLPESIVVVRNNEIVTEDVVLRDEDEVELIPVISGGSR